jgi:hypothetical protein
MADKNFFTVMLNASKQKTHQTSSGKPPAAIPLTVVASPSEVDVAATSITDNTAVVVVSAEIAGILATTAENEGAPAAKRVKVTPSLSADGCASPPADVVSCLQWYNATLKATYTDLGLYYLDTEVHVRTNTCFVPF